MALGVILRTSDHSAIVLVTFLYVSKISGIWVLMTTSKRLTKFRQVSELGRRD
jgi:hypothetical protein